MDNWEAAVKARNDMPDDAKQTLLLSADYGRSPDNWYAIIKFCGIVIINFYCSTFFCGYGSISAIKG